jgi:hypothetical protein
MVDVRLKFCLCVPAWKCQVARRDRKVFALVKWLLHTVDSVHVASLDANKFGILDVEKKSGRFACPVNDNENVRIDCSQVE